MTVLNLLRRSATFDALRDPHFRWYWIGMLASSATMQMAPVGQTWAQAPHPMQAAAMKAVSATSFGTRISLASRAAPVFTET